MSDKSHLSDDAYKKEKKQLQKYAEKRSQLRKEWHEQKAWRDADASIIPEHVPPRDDPSDRKYKDPTSYVKKMHRERDWWEYDIPLGDSGDYYLGQKDPRRKPFSRPEDFIARQV